NTPRRGIGKTTVENLNTAAQELGLPLWEIISDETSVATLAGRAAKRVAEFANLIKTYQAAMAQELPAAEIVRGILKESGYVQDLQNQGTEEADSRLENLNELHNAVVQFQEENETDRLEDFLANAALASDLDNLPEEQEAVSLMTLHSAKGLEFPVVFMVGMEQGLFPSSRSLNDPASLEEERRLCYVGITRAQEQLFLSHARTRRLWGTSEGCVPSQFLGELPEELVQFEGDYQRRQRQRRPVETQEPTPKELCDWEVGDRVLHDQYGEGQITHVFGTKKKVHLGIRFMDLNGPKIVDAKIAPLTKLNEAGV
ncbi:MAG: 3'-5' exonuclease, partial [Spirulinaceae cyanobacterium]